MRVMTLDEADLARRFVAQLTEPGRDMDHSALGAELAQTFDLAAQAWPGLPFARAGAFAEALAREVPPGADPLEHLRGLRGADRFLAYLCAEGEPAAIAAFEATLIPQMESALSEVRAPSGQRDEIKQLLRERFFVGRPGHPPVIAGYTGRGSLRGWVRISVLREVYRTAQSERRWQQLEEEQLARFAATEDDPELALLKEQYRDAFRTAFSGALQELSPRQRNLLRHYYLDGMTVEQIGRLYQFHKATATRQLARIRELLLEQTRQAMMSALAVGDADCDSILRLIKSQLEISICTHLRPDE
jgi:RNA polymerase sigma-70 factor (ECF subfamily)